MTIRLAATRLRHHLTRTAQPKPTRFKDGEGRDSLLIVTARYVQPEEFEAIVRETLEDLPERFKPMLENVAVVVAEEPDPDDLESLGMDPRDELLGLYHGVPLTDRDTGYTGLPDRVLIYSGPILRCCDTAHEVRQQIRETVIHEIGHHFGLSDDEMVF